MVKLRSDAGRLEITGQGPKFDITVSGPLDVRNAAIRLDQLKKFVTGQTRASTVSMDVSKVEYMDTYGALIIQELRKGVEGAGGTLTLNGIGAGVERMIALTKHAATAKTSVPQTTPLPAGSPPSPGQRVVRLGRYAIDKSSVFGEVLGFAGATFVTFGQIIKRPTSMRWGDVIGSMHRVGVEALPIVGLISFLLGLIIAFMSAVQLKQFGANIYVASLVGLGMTRELGPIITCIIMSGRSGAAFAAEIGTMKVSREVDSLTTMGFDISKFLVMPKVIAAIAMVPILTLFSDLLACLGGLVVGVTMLDLTTGSYVSQLYKSVGLNDIGIGLLKSMVFALLIALIGCYWGMKVRGGADAVGQSTTRAVVSGIFLVIVCDSIFAVVLRYIG